MPDQIQYMHQSIAQAVSDHEIDTLFGLVGDANLFIANHFVKLSKSNEILVASIPGVIKENLKGKDLNLSFDESKIHLFDVNSDQRIN